MRRLAQFFFRALDGRATIGVQDPDRLSDLSIPQPDLTVSRLDPRFYADRHPGPGDVLLIVEVADSSLEYDRAVKGPLYAAAGIPEYWLVDLAPAQVEVHRGPGPGQYQHIHIAPPGQKISPEAFPDVAIEVELLF